MVSTRKTVAGVPPKLRAYLRTPLRQHPAAVDPQRVVDLLDPLFNRHTLP
jgi:hypothetical protein